MTTTNFSKPVDTEIANLQNAKLDKPSGVAEGKYLQTNSSGQAVWGDAASPSAVASATEDWLEANVPSGTTIAIDRSLSISNAAAPADIVGDFKNELTQKMEYVKPANQWNDAKRYQDI